MRRAGRCYLECDDRPWLDLGAMLHGRLEPRVEAVVRVYMPPAIEPIELRGDEAQLLAACPQGAWTDPATLASAAIVRRLVTLGLLLEEADGPADDPPPVHALDDWFGPAALYHYAGRWQGVTARTDLPQRSEDVAATFAASAAGFAQDAARRGAAPTHRHERGDDGSAVELPRSAPDDFDRLLARRETHRLFDPGRALPVAVLGQLLYRSLATIAEAPLGGGHVAQRKHVPSGGGLHPVEAYVLAAHVAGLAGGWYHYRSHQHRLAPIAHLDRDAAQQRIASLTAGQVYFRDAAALVLLTLRFPRHHWKYPRHAKAYRVMLLDAGHIAQMFALAATQAGIGAFVTAAINEIDAERELGLDGIGEGAVAALGCGYPAADGAELRLSRYVVAD